MLHMSSTYTKINIISFRDEDVPRDERGNHPCGDSQRLEFKQGQLDGSQRLTWPVCRYTVLGCGGEESRMRPKG